MREGGRVAHKDVLPLEDWWEEGNEGERRGVMDQWGRGGQGCRVCITLPCWGCPQAVSSVPSHALSP